MTTPVQPSKTKFSPAMAVLQQGETGTAVQGMGGPQINPMQPNVAFGNTQPSTGGMATQTIDANQNLRNQMIIPQNSARTTATQGLTNQAANQVAQGGYSPYSAYQQLAQPYQQAGAGLYSAAAGALGQQQQYTSAAGNAIQNVGLGSYGSIAPTVSGGGGVSGPTYQQGQVSLPGVSTGPVSGLQNLQFGGDTNALRNAVSSGISGLNNSPDRVALAQQAFDLFNEQQAPQLQQATRELGQGASAFGRMGSGLINTQLADLGTAYAQSADQQRRALSLDAADKTLSDQLSRLGATQSGLGQLAGLDTQLNESGNRNILDTYDRNISRDSLVNDLALNQAQFNAGRDDARNAANFQSQAFNADNAFRNSSALYDQLANERNFQFGVDNARNDLAFQQGDFLRGLGSDSLAGGRFSQDLGSTLYDRGDRERNFLQDYETTSNNYGLDRLGALSNLEGQQFSQDQSMRNELRGERGYQNELEDQAYNRALEQLLTEEQLYGNEWSRRQQQMGNLANLGYGVDPYSAMADQAANYGQQGAGMLGAGAQGIQDYFATPRGRPKVPGTPASSGAWEGYG